MNTDNKFEWTDELVKEFYEQVYCTPSINTDKDIEDFKQSKVKEAPLPEKIEVKIIGDGNESYSWRNKRCSN